MRKRYLVLPSIIAVAFLVLTPMAAAAGLDLSIAVSREETAVDDLASTKEEPEKVEAIEIVEETEVIEEIAVVEEEAKSSELISEESIQAEEAAVEENVISESEIEQQGYQEMGSQQQNGGSSSGSNSVKWCIILFSGNATVEDHHSNGNPFYVNLLEINITQGQLRAYAFSGGRFTLDNDDSPITIIGLWGIIKPPSSSFLIFLFFYLTFITVFRDDLPL